MGNSSAKTKRSSSDAPKHVPPPPPKASRIVRQDPPEDPFVSKDSTRTDVLIRAGGDRSFFDSGVNGKATRTLLESLQSAFGGKQKASIVNESIHHDFVTQTLKSIPGYSILVMPPKVRWSRMRNVKADNWRGQAYDKADAFVYAVDIANMEEYLGNTTEGPSQSRGWEHDRFEVTQLLRKPALVENPQKPLLLLVNINDGEDFDNGRLVHLLGLDRVRRPFRAVSYSPRHPDSLRGALEWLAKTAKSDGDEATAMTDSETVEENSVTTAGTSSTVFSGADAYVLDYEPTLQGGNPTLQRFEPIKRGTHCPFARAANLWGGKLPDDTTPSLHRSLGSDDRYADAQEMAALNAGPLAEFVERSNDGEPLDGFCLEIPRAEYSQMEILGQKVRHILTNLAELDPSPGENCMTKMGPIDQPQWRFRFAGEDFFVTTFSPSYKSESSRYAFGAKRAFLLLQPNTSFGRHGLTEDTPASATNWDKPKTMRDKARVAFKKNGRPYHIPEELPYPVAEHFVKPQMDDGTSCIRWWEPLETEKKKQGETTIFAYED